MRRPGYLARFLLNFALCLLVIAFAWPLQGEQFTFQVFRQTDGLQNLNLSSIAIDRQGFVWAGTENGVYRFLGSEFQRYGVAEGLTSLFVQDMLVDSSGVLWVATDQDLYYWDGMRFLTAWTEPIRTRGRGQIAIQDNTHLLISQGSTLLRLEHDLGGKGISGAKPFEGQLS